MISTAAAIVQFVLSGPSCARARAGKFEDCACGCVGVFTRHVEELLEADYARVIAEHQTEICAQPAQGLSRTTGE